jgi:hypothetical protein
MLEENEIVAGGKSLVVRSEFSKYCENMSEKFDAIKDSINNLAIDVAALPDKILIRADQRYADKKTEKLMDKIVWLLISSLVMSLFAIILAGVKK